MDNNGRHLQNLGLRLFDYLLKLYPARFRREFSSEIRAVFLSRMREAQEHGRVARLTVIFQEITGLVISILRECWHELRVRKEKTKVSEDPLQNDSGAEGGMPTLRPVGIRGALWFAGWTLLTTAAFPAAYLTMPLLAAMFMWLIDLGVKAGFWPAVGSSTLEMLGALISFALVLASVQSYLLRRFLPRAWLWFTATGAGVLLGGFVIWVSWQVSSGRTWNPIWFMAAVLLPFGLALGLAQWLYLRRFLPNAFWIIIVDVLATGSLTFAGQSFNSLAELILVLLLPGVITGLGLWFLLSQSHPQMPSQARIEPSRGNSRWLPRLAWIGLGLVALVPLFFLFTWAYSASQLALAKNEGIYSTPEEGMRTMAQESYSTDYRVKILAAGPNSFDGSQAHIWYVIAEVRASSRADGSELGHNACDAPGSFFIQTREGWVHVPEGAFPEFIGFWMKVYGWAGEGQSTPSTDWAPGQSSRFCQ